MKKKYLSLLILPLLAISVSSCDSITIIDSREDISPTNPSDSTNLDTNTYSIVVAPIPTISVGKSSPVSVTLITTTEDGDTTYVSGDSSDVLLISSDTSILTVSKMNLVGVKVGQADLTVRWASHPSASVTVENIYVDIGYTYDVTLNYYIEDVDDDDDDDDDDAEDDDDEESGPVAVSSISIDIEDSLSFSDFEILLGTLVDDGVDPKYTQVEFTDDEYQGEDTLTFVSSNEDVLKVCECGDHVIALTSGKADLSVYWEDHEVYSNSIQVTVNETDPGDDGNTEPGPDDGGNTEPDQGDGGNTD